jgi:hypothetical protein
MMTHEFNPRPMFGKHSYLSEQLILNSYTNNVSKGLFMIDPHITRMPFPLITMFSIEKRRELAKRHLGKALIDLKNLGV